MPHRQQPSMHASPPHFRPSTPASSESRTRGTPSRAREHAYARSQHSHSGSIFHNSDAGSDQGFHTPSSPPPVPRMPAMFNPFGHPDDSRTLADLEDKITMEPRTPSDYALHAIFIRFATTAEGHIEHFLRLTLVCWVENVADTFLILAYRIGSLSSQITWDQAWTPS